MAEPALEEAMDAVRTLATLGRAAREEAAAKGANPLVRKVRQPIGRVVCVVRPTLVERVRQLLPLLEAELNARTAELATSADALVTLEAKPNFRTLGKKFGKSTPRAAEQVSKLPSAALLAFERGEPLELTVDGTTRSLEAEDLTVVRRAVGELVVAERGGYFAAIDPTVTPALRREGLVRELIAAIQRLRKDSGLAVSDRIVVGIGGDGELLAAVKEHRDHVAGEVLAVEVAIGDETTRDHQAVQELDLDGVRGRIALTRKS